MSYLPCRWIQNKSILLIQARLYYISFCTWQNKTHEHTSDRYLFYLYIVILFVQVAERRARRLREWHFSVNQPNYLQLIPSIIMRHYPGSKHLNMWFVQKFQSSPSLCFKTKKGSMFNVSAVDAIICICEINIWNPPSNILMTATIHNDSNSSGGIIFESIHLYTYIQWKHFRRSLWMITYGYDDAITVSTEWNRYICLCLLQVLYVSHYVYAMNSILVYEYGALFNHLYVIWDDSKCTRYRGRYWECQ